jgi:hypothetical protein
MDVHTIIVETANRFARDLIVQEVGFAMLRDLSVTLIAANSPSSFLDARPTSKLIPSQDRRRSGRAPQKADIICGAISNTMCPMRTSDQLHGRLEPERRSSG